MSSPLQIYFCPNMYLYDNKYKDTYYSKCHSIFLFKTYDNETVIWVPAADTILDCSMRQKPAGFKAPAADA